MPNIGPLRKGGFHSFTIVIIPWLSIALSSEVLKHNGGGIRLFNSHLDHSVHGNSIFVLAFHNEKLKK